MFNTAILGDGILEKYLAEKVGCEKISFDLLENKNKWYTLAADPAVKCAKFTGLLMGSNEDNITIITNFCNEYDVKLIWLSLVYGPKINLYIKKHCYKYLIIQFDYANFLITELVHRVVDLLNGNHIGEYLITSVDQLNSTHEDL